MNQMTVLPPPLPAAVSFSGERGEFRRLVMRGAVLELVTVGFYRFWLATDIRREIWQKFVFLVALSGTTTTMRSTIGLIAGPE